MKKILASRWIEISANLGIVVGLLLVAAQMKQTSDLQRLQMLHAESRGMVELDLAMLGENPATVWAKSLRSPRNLSLEERKILEAYLYIFLEQLRTTFLLEQEGLLEKGEWQRRVRLDAAYILGNPYAFAWWNGIKYHGEIPQELKSFIDKEIGGDIGRTMSIVESPLRRLDELTDDDSAAILEQ